MNSYDKSIFVLAAVAAALLLGMPGCTIRNKVVVDPGTATVEVQRDPSGATSVRVTPRNDQAVARPVAMTTSVAHQTNVDGARRELADLQTQLDGRRRELAAVENERVRAIETRDKAAVEARDSLRAIEVLNTQVQQLSADKAEMEKELADLITKRDKVNGEVGASQRVADVLAGEIQQMEASKAAVERETTAATARLEKAEETLATANADLAAHEANWAELDKQHAETSAALETARTELGGVNADATEANADLNGLREQIDTRTRELAEVTARATASKNTAASQAAHLGEATAAVDGDSNGHAVWIGPIVGVVVAILAVTAAAGMYLNRKPAIYTFALLDENSKASHRLQLTSAERVEVGGAAPDKRVGGKARVPFLTIDHKGRLVFHPMVGFPTKLNDRLVSITDTPIVKPGSVLEITADGQAHRLVVGPVSAVDPLQKPSVKLPGASVRPA